MCAKVREVGHRLQIEQKPHIQLAQHLIMSAQMQQAIHLLQLPVEELEPFLEEQIVLNPVLEIDQREGEKNESIDEKTLSIFNRLEEDSRDYFFEQGSSFSKKRSSEEEKLKSYLEQSVHINLSLRDRLMQQAHDSFETPRELEIAEILIGYLDEWGFLQTPLSEVCALHQLTKEEVESVLKEIQTFEPYGIGASNTQESLLIQLRCLHKEQTLAYRIIQDYYDQLLHNQIPFIQKHLNCSYQDIQREIEKNIAKLDLHPGTRLSPASHPIVPDVTIRQENEQLIVEVERDYAPRLRLNLRYLKMFNNPSVPQETKQFIKRHIFSARWLMRNLQQRYSTLERITQSLADKQYCFFTQPDGKLVPLTMKTLAEELDLHESTIVRTVANKYLYSPRGLFPLRTFFTNKYLSEEGEDLSSTTVKQAMLDLIQKEDKKHPLSDEKISFLLKQKGIPCARRTIAKYRFMLHIGNTQQRRKFI